MTRFIPSRQMTIEGLSGIGEYLIRKHEEYKSKKSHDAILPTIKIGYRGESHSTSDPNEFVSSLKSIGIDKAEDITFHLMEQKKRIYLKLGLRDASNYLSIETDNHSDQVNIEHDILQFLGKPTLNWLLHGNWADAIIFASPLIPSLFLLIRYLIPAKPTLFDYWPIVLCVILNGFLTFKLDKIAPKKYPASVIYSDGAYSARILNRDIWIFFTLIIVPILLSYLSEGLAALAKDLFANKA